MSGWTITDSALAEDFGDLQLAKGKGGDEINANWMSRLVKCRVGDDHYYVKTYASRGRGLRRWLGRSRLRAEWENLQLFNQLGIATAELIAYGETSGFDYEGALVTKELSGTRDLAELAREQSSHLSDRSWRLQVIRRLSDAVRTLHGNGFIHNDLKWRNILVELNSNPGVYLIDCPMGRTLWGPLLARGRIKDLACLDKVAKNAVSRTDRLRFFLAYLGKDRLAGEDKEMIRKILVFFSGRE